MTTAIAMFLKPFFYFVLFAVVIAPTTWVLWRIIPDGRFKIWLFRVRSGEGTSGRDKLLMAIAGILSYVFLGFLVVTLSK